MKSKKRFFNSNTKLLLKLAFPYLMLLFCIMAIGSLTYYQALKVTREYAIEDAVLNLNHEINIFEKQLKELNSMVYTLQTDKDVFELYNRDEPFKWPYYKVNEMMEALQIKAATNEMVHDIILSFAKSEFLLSTETSTSRLQDYYSGNNYNQNISYEQWKTLYFSRGKNDFLTDDSKATDSSETRYLTYIKPFTLDIGDDFRGNIIIQLDEQKVWNYFSALNTSKDFFCIYNDIGEVITSRNDNNYKDIIDLELPRGENRITTIKDSILIYIKSDTTGWTYVVSIPKIRITSKIEYIQNIFIITAIILLLLGTIAILYLSYSKSKPIYRIISSMCLYLKTTPSNAGNEILYIEDGFNKIIQSNENLKEESVKQRHLLYSGSFERLLHGGIQDVQEVQNLLDFNYNEDVSFIISILKIVGLSSKTKADINKLHNARVLVNSELQRFLPDNFIVHNTENDKVVILIKTVTEKLSEDLKRIRQYYQTITNILKNQYQINITIGIGNPYDSAFAINTSFQEAKTALYYIHHENQSNIINYSEIEGKRQGCYYPIELEARFINVLKNGIDVEYEKIIKTLYKENFDNRILSLSEAQMLLSEIKGTISKVLVEVNMDKYWVEKINYISSEMDDCVYTKTFFECVKKSCDTIKEYVEISKQRSKKVLDLKIEEYINDHFLESNFSFASVANKFNFNESYFSQLFKSNFGATFSSYINKKRLDYSIDLLKNSDLSIKNISYSIGYTNVSTYYRAFRRKYGCSPSAYRSNENKGNTI